MTRQRESKLSTKIQTELRKLGVFVFKVHGSEHMQAGLPDLIACVDGRFVGLEVKLPGEEHAVSKIQQLRHDEIRAAGGLVWVITNVDQALSIVKSLRLSESD